MTEVLEPSELAGKLAGAAGLPEPLTCDRLTGGRNNRAYKIGFSNAADAVLKLYHHDPRDTRDRLGAEWNFLHYVQKRGVQNVPELLARDDASHAGLMGFIHGTKRTAATITRDDLQQAIDFIAAINGTPRTISDLRPGSEACFSLDAHLQTVDRRVARLSNLDPEAPCVSGVVGLVANQILPEWARIRDAVLESAGRLNVDCHKSLEEEHVCVSPSDFGFHNALVGVDGRVMFIDFEYAGYDDPAKLICDFLCQPEVPVPPDMTEWVSGALSDALKLPDILRIRSQMLLDTYRMKWICIMLNEFLPVDGNRREFAGQDTRHARATAQIEKVRTALEQLHS